MAHTQSGESMNTFDAQFSTFISDLLHRKGEVVEAIGKSLLAQADSAGRVALLANIVIKQEETVGRLIDRVGALERRIVAMSHKTQEV